MRWSPQELLYELRRDSARRVLFVEGLRDVSFWRSVEPLADRVNAAIYPISKLDCPGGEGGERGRLIKSAGAFVGLPEGDRIRFFADADHDRLLGVAIPANVLLTDGRDLESYGLTESCLERICRIGFPASTDTGARVLRCIHNTVRPIAILRLISDKETLHLPFGKTFENFARFIVEPTEESSLDLRRLVSVLLQNGGFGLGRVDKIMLAVKSESQTYSAVPDSEIIHGKDLLRFLGLRFGIGIEEIERHFFMSAGNEVERIREQPSVRATRRWLGLDT